MTRPAALGHVWVVTRAFALWVAAVDPGGDLVLFHTFSRLMQDGFVPYRNFVAEYPPLAMALFRGVGAFSHSYGHFRVIWVLVALGCDALLLWVLGRKSVRAGWLYVAASTPLLGVGLNRFDLFPALATVAALLSWERARPTWAGSLLGIGAGLKLYPLILAPVLVLDAVRRRAPWARAVVSLAAVATVSLVAPALLVGNFTRWHTARGLHIEAVLSTPWLLRAAPPVLDQTFGSYDLAGALPMALADGSPWAQLLGVAVVLAWAYRRQTVAQMAYAALLVALCLGKTLSPQFLLWVAPLFALAEPRGWRVWAFLGAALLTLPIFPFLYDELVRGWIGARGLIASRNLLLVIAMLGAMPGALTSSWEAKAPAPRSPASSGPPGAFPRESAR